ncbi:MAG: calcium/sodium antiporter [Methyloligellaceae bacterium]
MAYVTLAAGLSLLLICGDALVRGAVALAVRLNIPTLVIGLTVVAFGTSAPELVVSLRAALAGSPGIAIGNVVGSNIANVLLVLGVPALICATNCDQPLIKRNMVYVLGASVLFIWLCFFGPLTFWHGLVLFAFLVAFLIDSGRRAKSSSSNSDVIGSETEEIIDDLAGMPQKGSLVALYLVVGIIGLKIGAYLTVISAVDIARTFGVSETTVGLTIVALGTSLPELATTVAAAMRGQCGIALGNVLGSNLFNLLAIMGLTAMVVPVPVPGVLITTDLWVMLAASLVITPFIMKRLMITRTAGIAFVLCYVAYVVVAFLPRSAEMASYSH